MVGIMISLEEVEANRKRSRLGKKEKLKLSTPSSTLVTTTTATTVAVSSDTRDSDSIVQQIPSKENWEWTNLIDSNSINVPILFSTDSKYSFVAVGSALRIYSIATTQLLSTLSIPSTPSTSQRRSKISCLLLNPSNHLQLIVGYLDGMLRFWNYTEGILIRTLSLGSPVQHACAHSSLKDQLFVALISEDAEEIQESTIDVAGIYSISLKPKASLPSALITPDTPRSPAKRMRLAKPRVVVSLGLSSSGAFLIAVNPNQINLCNTKQLHRGFASRIDSLDTFTCLAFHPTENYFATGNAAGQIRFWYGVLEEGAVWEAAVKLGKSKATANKSSTSLFHWHAHAVKAITFTPNGAYLLSGGEEAVLVLWQLHTGHQEYVPRLGSPILSLAINNSPEQEQQVAARLRDGSVVFIGSQKLKITKSIAGIKADPVRMSDTSSNDRHSRIPLSVQPITRHLVLPSGHPSSLQFYSLVDDTQTLEVEVSPSNRVSAAGSKAIEPTRVELVAFSQPSTSSQNDSGYWMATLDTWSNESFAEERHIKFWRHSPNSDGFELSTRIDGPHDDDITSMSFSPSAQSPLLLTTSLDKSIKVWSYSGDSWRCRSSSCYRSLTPIDAAWSLDGSMFAVAYKKSVTLWSIASNSLIHVFDCKSIGPVKKVEFMGEEGTMLLAGGKHGSTVWDLLTFEESLGMSCLLNDLTPKPNSSLFVATESSSSQSTVSASYLIDATAHTSQSRQLPFPVVQSIYLESNDRLSLVVINSAGEVILVNEKLTSTMEPVRVVTSGTRLPNTKDGQSRLFDEIFGTATSGDREGDRFIENKVARPTQSSSSSSSKVVAGGKKGDLEILNAPAHTLPPAKLLWREMLGTFARPTITGSLLAVEATAADADAVDEDIDMGIEKEEVTKGIRYGAVEKGSLDEIFKLQLSSLST